MSILQGAAWVFSGALLLIYVRRRRQRLTVDKDQPVVAFARKQDH